MVEINSIFIYFMTYFKKGFFALSFLLLMQIGAYAQFYALPDSIHAIAPLSPVLISAYLPEPIWDICTCPIQTIPVIKKSRVFSRKYDTTEELIYMYSSEVFMADPSARRN